MTQAIRTISVVDADGNVQLPSMPQAVGRTVEVIILVEESTATIDRFPLHDEAYDFADPFSPVTDPDDWDVHL